MFIKFEIIVNIIERKLIYMRDVDFLILSVFVGFIIMYLIICRNIYNVYGIVMVYFLK